MSLGAETLQTQYRAYGQLLVMAMPYYRAAWIQRCKQRRHTEESSAISKEADTVLCWEAKRGICALCLGMAVVSIDLLDLGVAPLLRRHGSDG